MHIELTMPLSPVLFASDARGSDDGPDFGGYSVVAAQAGSDRILRILEKCMRPGHTVTKLDGSFVGRRRPEEPWKRTVSLTRAAAEMDEIPEAAWRWVDAGLWRFADHITLGEGRAVVRLVRLLASDRRAHGF